MSKEALAQRVLANPNVQIYGCGRAGHPQRPDRPPRAGDARVPRRLRPQADGHVAALRPLVLHGLGQRVRAHDRHRGRHRRDQRRPDPRATRAQGSITELAIQRLLTLQGTMKPHQIISLMEFQGTDNTFAMADHADHIHVGFRPLYGANAKTAKQVDAILKPEQWIKLIDRLDEIDNPTVAAQAVQVRGRGGQARQPGPQGRVATPALLRLRPVGAARAARTGSRPLRRAALRGRRGAAGRGDRRARRAAARRASAAAARGRPSPAPRRST